MRMVQLRAAAQWLLSRLGKLACTEDDRRKPAIDQISIIRRFQDLLQEPPGAQYHLEVCNNARERVRSELRCGRAVRCLRSGASRVCVMYLASRRLPSLLCHVTF